MKYTVQLFNLALIFFLYSHLQKNNLIILQNKHNTIKKQNIFNFVYIIASKLWTNMVRTDMVRKSNSLWYEVTI